MKKKKLQITVKKVFKCAKPVNAHLVSDQTTPTNTNDPTTTLVTFTVLTSIVPNP